MNFLNFLKSKAFWLKLKDVVLYNFPLQLFWHNVKSNLSLLLLWAILLGIVSGDLGKGLGVPSLFLEPEYQHKVSVSGCVIMGICWGTFMMNFHIACYVLDAPKFVFLGNLRKPFAHFFINNSFYPIFITFVYLYTFLDYQMSYERYTKYEVLYRFLGLLGGILSSSIVLYHFFNYGSMGLLSFFAQKMKNPLKKIQIVRVNVLGRLKDSRKINYHVEYYIDYYLRWQYLPQKQVYDYGKILGIFDKNHFNAVFIQFNILIIIVLLGTFRDHQVFQIPAGASLLLLFTVILMLVSALHYWLRGWVWTFGVCALLFVSYLMENDVFSHQHAGYGLDYNGKKAEYTLENVQEMSNDSLYKADYNLTLRALENWREKHHKTNPFKKPKMVFLCVSGGGQRAATWTMRTLQYVDSTLDNKLMQHTMLITGASGGLIGASYFRELCLRRELFWRGLRQEYVNPYHIGYFRNIAKDNLNALMFSLVVNDLFFGFQTFEYAGRTYPKDRGFAFEQQLNRNTEGFLDKPLCDYKEAELYSMVPMVILSPTIVNDGRKLFVSALPVTYMTAPRLEKGRFLNQKTKGIDFSHFFAQQQAHDLRFLSALRMSATFPYVTPNITLPSEPEMEIMDAGVSDNFGVSDAVRFVATFKNWLQKNTSGIVFVSIRDTQKNPYIERKLEQSLLQKIFSPLTSFFINLEYVQDIHNDNLIEASKNWFPDDFPIQRIEFQYVPIARNWQEIQERLKNPDKRSSPYQLIKSERAALSWRLTEKEKESLYRTIFEPRNQFAMRNLAKILK